MTKRILSVILAFVFLFSFSSCGADNENSFDELNEVISSYEDMISKQESEKAEKKNNRFVIVIPVKCGAELFDSAAFLSDTVSKFVGYEVEVYYDADLKKTSSVVEILVGDTDREEGQRFLKELRSFDYGYKYCDGAVVVAAHSEELTCRAVEAFAEKLASGEIDPIYINALKPYTVCTEYAVDEVKLCGFELSEYTVVYPAKNTKNEQAVALKLKALFEERFGYSLRVLDDGALSGSERAVCIGKTSLTTTSVDASAATVSLSEGGEIELLADDCYGLCLAIENFVREIESTVKDRRCALSLSGKIKYEYDNDELSFLIIRGDLVSGDIDTYIDLVSKMRSSSVSVIDNLSSRAISNIRVNECNISNVDTVSFYYCDGHKYWSVEANAKEISDGEILTMLFERANGDRFVFIGGFCKKDAKMKSSEEFYDRLVLECQKYSDLPVIVAHELTYELDGRFEVENPRFAKVNKAEGIYFSSDRFELVKYNSYDLNDLVAADSVRLNICYK